MAAKVEIIYEAEASSLKAVVNEVNKANDAVVASAQQTSTKFVEEFKNASKGAANAFANQQLKGAIKNLNTEVATLTNGLKLNTDALKKFDTEAQKTNKILIQSAQDVAKYEDRLRELSVAGQRATQEFEDIARAVGEYKSAIIAADRAVDLYAKSTDAATGRIGELEDKLYDLALAGKSNTQEFKDLVREVSNVKRAIVETDKQVDSFVERSRGFGTVVQNVELVGNAFQVVEGAAALFGDENEELQKTLVKLQAITAITSGIEQARLILLDQTAQKTGIAAVAQRAYGLAVGQSTGFLKAFRIALLATGVGALAVGLIAIINNFDKVKAALQNSIPGFKSVSNAIGNVIDTIKDWISASSEAERAGAAFENASKRQADATKQIIDGYNRRIEVEKAAGRNTTQLEIEREKAVIAANQKIIKDFEAKQSKILDLDKEERDKFLQTQKEAADAVQEASNNILTIRAEAEKQATDKAKEEAKKAAEAEKKEAEDLEKQRKELLDKRIKNNQRANEQIAASREADLQEELAAVAVAEDASFELKIQSLEKQKAIEIEAAETAGLLTYEIAKKYDDLIAEQKKQQAQAQLDAQINALKTLEINEGTSLDRRIELIELEAQKRIEAAKDNASEIVLIEAETQAAIRAERKKSTDEAVEDAFELASTTADALGSILKFQSQLTENRIADIQSTSEKELEAINNSLDSEVTKANKREALEKRTQAKIAAEKQKQAKQEKALNIFKATIDTAASIVKTGAQLGYPAAIPFQVLAGIIGAANIAAIAAQPLPKFKRGGMVGGQSHEAGGTLIEAERGEFVVNKDSVRRNRRELDAINTSSAAFKRLIDERYVRPAILNYAMNSKRDGITVNASLNSKSMERELRGLRKDMRNKNTIVNINGGDSRYSWQ